LQKVKGPYKIDVDEIHFLSYTYYQVQKMVKILGVGLGKIISVDYG